jgi:hypothetical protein
MAESIELFNPLNSSRRSRGPTICWRLTRIARPYLLEDLIELAQTCANCHVPPLFTEPGNNLHAPSEIGVDSFQADRSPTHMYRTAPLAGLWSHQNGGFYHDGRFATLGDMVEHYNMFLNLGLTDQEKTALVEYLKSI